MKCSKTFQWSHDKWIVNPIIKQNSFGCSCPPHPKHQHTHTHTNIGSISKLKLNPTCSPMGRDAFLSNYFYPWFWGLKIPHQTRTNPPVLINGGSLGGKRVWFFYYYYFSEYGLLVDLECETYLPGDWSRRVARTWRSNHFVLKVQFP